MNRNQRNANRATAKRLGDEVLEKNLPDGLIISDGVLLYDCASCGRECEWYGTPEDFADPNSIKVGGCSVWCLP